MFMKKSSNRKAAAFLLLGVGVAGRAFLSMPDSVSTLELSLTALLLVGALLLSRQLLRPLVAAVIALGLELVLCGDWVHQGGLLAAASPFLRLADLWVLLGLVSGALNAARPALDDLRYTRSTHNMLLTSTALLALHTMLRLINMAVPHNTLLNQFVSISFVIFSVSLLWFTILMIRAYNTLRRAG